MILTESLRYLILGSPLYMPNIVELNKFFKYEMNNIYFLMYLFLTFLYVLILLLLLNKRPNINGLIIDEGLLLLLCALCLNRVSYLERINFSKNKNLFSSLIDIQILESKSQNTVLKQIQKPLNIKSESYNFIDSTYNILIKHQANLEKLDTFYINLNILHKTVNENFKYFSEEFKKWKNVAKSIDRELNILNSSPRYFENELKDLRNEIDKFFRFMDIPEKRQRDKFIKDFIFNLKDMKKSKEKKILKIYNIYILKNLVNLKYLFIVVAIIAILFLIISSLEIYTYARISQNYVCLSLILFCIINVLILGCVQLLDRTCKIERVNNCDTFFDKQFSTFIQNEDFEIFNKQFNLFVDERDKDSQNYKKYLYDLISERIHYKVLVFKNLFDKIIFVKDDFDLITKKIINKDLFFKQINIMYSILDKFTTTFNNSIKFQFVEIFVNEIGYSQYFVLNKEMIIDTIQKTIKNKNQKQQKRIKKSCGLLLNDICTSKTVTEDIFNLSVVFGVVIFILNLSG